uniref:Ig-like domain-containing protein n=1 Tax=Terrapene triunguis TaxID=2587831 RepID=A0A674K497_9SAUR
MRIPRTRELRLGVCGAGKPSLPRPSISLSPTGVTAPGADVTIRCQGQRRDVRFFLHKAGDSNPQRHMDPAGAGAEFRIPTMGRQHGGSYSCSYQPQSESFVFSEPSDPVELVVLPAPRPSISVSPSGVIAVGGAVTIRCQCRCEARRLFLYKDKIQIRELDAAGDGGEFTIPSARWADGGVYMCQSRSRSEPPNWSDPSDIVRIIVAGEGPGSAFPLPAPHPARPSWGSLGRWDTPWDLALGWGLFLTVSVQHPGPALGTSKPNTCLGPHSSSGRSSQEYMGCRRGSSGWVFSQGPRLWDHAARSDCAGVCLTACLLLIAEPSYPKPSISLSPNMGVTLGGAVTIQCWGQHQNMRFLMYKDGNPNVLQDAEPAGNLAEFPIRSVNRRDAGSYSCYYHKKWYPFTWSHPSDSMELVVAGELPGSVSALPAAHPAGHSGAGACARGASRCRAPESVGLEHRTPPGRLAACTRWLLRSSLETAAVGRPPRIPGQRKWGELEPGMVFFVVGRERKQRGTAASSSSPAPSAPGGNGW